MSGWNLEEELEKVLLAEIMAEMYKDVIEAMVEAIDVEREKDMEREIYWRWLIGNSDWHRVTLNRVLERSEDLDITSWLGTNITATYKRYGDDFLFSSETDAVYFAMKWS
jgi:hypothetical protein